MLRGIKAPFYFGILEPDIAVYLFFVVVHDLPQNEGVLSLVGDVTRGRFPSPDNSDRRDASLISSLQKVPLLSWST